METEKLFTEYSFHNQLQAAIDKLGYKKCTPIQEKAITPILQGKDIAGLAQTGTGKTAAFLVPLIERIMRSGEAENFDGRGFPNWQKNNFVLVLVPTRELAEQVKDCALDFIADTEHRCVVVYGGVSLEKQISNLEKGYTILIATPGRLIDLYKQHKLDLKQAQAVVFDEADRMFDMGFQDDMKYILRRIPETRQLLMFSATLNLDVYNVAYQFGSNPVEMNVSQDKATADNVDDFIFHLGTNEKPQYLLAMFKRENPRQTIIFTNFKNNVDRIAEFLNRNGLKALGISSLMNQNQRQRVMGRFRSEDGEKILVATDVAARGLDIEGVDLVINFELPDDAENYVHRIGRTGRAGEKGKAFSFVSDKDVEALERITKYLGRKVETEWMETTDLPEDFQPFPAREMLVNKNRSQSFSRERERGQRQRPRNSDERGKRGGSDRKRTAMHSNDGPRREADGEQQVVASGNDARNVHRDRTRGRHKRQEEESAVEVKRSGGKNRRRRNNRKNFKGNGRDGNRPQQSPSVGRSQEQRPPVAAAAKPKSILGKVGSALKRLFS